MSRRQPVDNSATVSLFPFLAVLLCTMGALLVVLVAVSRAAREAAIRESAAVQQTVTAEPDPGLHRELDKIREHNSRLNRLRNQAEQQLREDQARLGHLENHMRQLQDQLAVLQAAAAELDALENEHYDDREQAQREIERLERLVDETRDAVDALKDQIQTANHSYALIPYEGPDGTYRRPIYIECHKDKLILQPEGVRISRVDLHPPFGAGNTLASALRAARNYHVQLHKEEGQNRDTEPYPLLVVRPDGLVMYDRARRAIESSDFDFGFELVEEDWELKYPVPDPQLASIEQQAIDQARIRQQALAAAAPRAFRNPALAAAGQFEPEEGGEAGFGYSEEGGESDAFAGGEGTDGTNDELTGDDLHQADRYAVNGGGQQPAADKTATDPHGAADVSTSEAASSPGNTPVNPGAAATNEASSITGSANSPGSAGGGGGESPDDLGANQIAVSRGTPTEEQREEPNSSVVPTHRGRDWALARKTPMAVPVRRTIQVLIRDDQITILADDAQIDQAAPTGQRIAIRGDTVESLNEVLAAVRKHIEGWGIAGENLYWRPVLILNIGPNGERRANDLNRLLKDSGIELRVAEFVNNHSRGPSRATPAR